MTGGEPRRRKVAVALRGSLGLTWLLALQPACAGPAPAAGPAAVLLAGAHRAFGSGVDSVRTISAVAAVSGPGGDFETRIASARDGSVRLALGSSLVAGVDGDRGWRCDSGGSPGPLDRTTRTVVHGHDLHMLALAPTAWLRQATLAGTRRWGGDSVWTVRFLDELDAPLSLFLRVADTLPVGLELINHTGRGPGQVRVFFEDWENRPGLRLFRRAVFAQGDNRFVYRYRTLEVNSLPDSAFRPACPGAADAAG